jgi:TetR/AcrR family transcriptional regulator, tetracycline repressor protein
VALTEDDVLDAACAILDEFGLADLTMRRLGDALGVRPGALYHHLPNKQTLLAHVADRVLATVPAPQGQWRPALSEWASGLRAALLARRDSADLVASARAMGLCRLDAVAHPARVLASAGVTTHDADAAAAAIWHFVLGHVAEEQARRDWERFGRPDPAAGPTATAATFDLGTALLLDGIAARFSLP